MIPQRPDVGCPNLKEGLSADWIVGFVDGEGCFHIGINKNATMKLHYQILPEFTVVQHQRDINLLYHMRTIMGCGVVRRNHDDRFCWRVRDLKHLQEIIVPFFEKHPLKSKKAIEFKKFARVVRLMSVGSHLEKDGFERIVKIAESMNRCTPRDFGQS